MDWNKVEMGWRDPKLKLENEGRLAMEIKGAADPFSRVVSLMDQFFKHMKAKQLKTPTVLLAILEKHCASGKGQAPISLQVKTSALNVALRQKNSNVLNKVCLLYRLADSSLDFLPTVSSLIQNKKYNEACIAATALKLQDHFTIQDMVIPLFLQDKMQPAENYLKGHQDMQVQFIHFLDGLLIDSRKPHALASSLAVPDVKYVKLQVKTIGKLLARLLKVFDIPPETCPNLCHVRGMGALKYLVNRRFIEGTVDGDNWTDLLLGAVGTNKELQRELLSLLVSYNEAQEALKWAVHFNVERHLWPPVLEQVLVQNVHREAERPVEEVVRQPAEQQPGGAEEEEVWELEDIAYLSFRLSRSDISIVETKEQFRSCLDEIQNYDVVALDGEWRPSFGMQQEKLSVLQMAVWDLVFLLDVQALRRVLTQADWTQLIDCILRNPDIQKLSYGFTSDLKQLSRIVPSAQAKLNDLKAMHDFSVLHPKFQVHCPELLVSPSPSPNRRPQDSRGLSSLTFTTLGLPLDKSV